MSNTTTKSTVFSLCAPEDRERHLKALCAQATKRSQYWISDAVANIESGASHEAELDDACDDFFRENQKHIGKRAAMILANDMLAILGKPAFFAL